MRLMTKLLSLVGLAVALILIAVISVAIAQADDRPEVIGEYVGWCERVVDDAFDFLERDAELYRYVTGALKTIECKRGDGPEVFPAAGLYVLDIEKSTKAYEATLLVHEACHVYQWLKGQTYTPVTALEMERECAGEQLKAALRLAPNTGIPRYLRWQLDNIDKPGGQWWLKGKVAAASVGETEPLGGPVAQQQAWPVIQKEIVPPEEPSVARHIVDPAVDASRHTDQTNVDHLCEKSKYGCPDGHDEKRHASPAGLVADDR